MTLIDINKFAGIVKKVDPTLLPPENGQSGMDFRLDNGALRAWRDVEDVGLSQTPNGTAVYHPNRYVNFSDGVEADGSVSVVHAVNAPMANDAFKRLYFTGDSSISDGVSAANVPKVSYAKWITTAQAQAQPPTACYRMGVPQFNTPKDKPSPFSEAIAKGKIKRIEIPLSTPTKTLVVPEIATGEPAISKKNLDTGDKVIIDFPGIIATSYAIARKWPGYVGEWDATVTYQIGDVVIVGTTTYVAALTTYLGESNIGKDPSAASSIWWSSLTAPTIEDISSFYLSTFKIDRQNWQTLVIPANATYLQVQRAGHGLNEGDKLVFKLNSTSWGGKLDRTKIGTVSKVISASQFEVTGLGTNSDGTIVTSATKRDVLAADMPSAFWVISKDGEDYYPQNTPPVAWDSKNNPTLIVIPQADKEEPDYARRTWVRADLVEQIVDRSYVVTCVNLFGEEGGPSYPSDTLEVIPGTDVTFNTNSLPRPALWAQHGLVMWRIYRTDSLGQFRYVEDILFPETATAATTWSGGTHYVAGDFVKVTSGGNTSYYRSLQGSKGISGTDTTFTNFNHDPANSPNWWSRAYVLSYTDTKDDSALAEPLPTQGYLPPPEQLRGLITIPGGMLVGFSGSQGGQRKEVCFSVPYQCHAWPIANRFSVEYEVVGLAATQAGVVVATKGMPYIIIGSDPGSMTVVKLEAPYACRSAKSIVDMGQYAMYAAPQGLVAVGGNTPELVTANILTREQWQRYAPAKLIGGLYDGKYMGFCPDRITVELLDYSAATTYEKGATMKSGGVVYISLQPGNINHSPTETDSAWWARAPLGFVFDPATGDWADLSTPYSAAVTFLPNDVLYLVSSTNAVYSWNAKSTYKPFIWTSAQFLAAQPCRFAAAQVVVDDYSSGEVKVRFFFDGVLKHTQRVAGAYVAGTAYSPSDTVVYGGLTYRALVATTGNAPPGVQWQQIAHGSEPFRLPSGFYVQSAWVTIEYGKFSEATPQTPGPISVRRVAFAESVGELKQAAA